MKKRLLSILVFVLILCIATTGFVFAKPVKTKALTLNITSVTLAQGDVVTIHATKSPAKATDKITWATSDDKIATVNKGTVKGISEGTATITAKAGKKEAKCVVTVQKYLTDADIKSENTKAEIIQLIKENTVSEDGIIGLIRKHAPGGSTTVINQYGDKTDWPDETELTLYNSSKGNVTIPGNYPIAWKNGDSKVVRLTKATVKKYHVDEYINDSFAMYKYVAEVEGVVPEDEATNNKFGAIAIAIFSTDMSSSGEFPLYRHNAHYIWEDVEYNEDDGKFFMKGTYYTNNNYTVFLPRCVNEM